jgi:hypothetical protein
MSFLKVSIFQTRRATLFDSQSPRLCTLILSYPPGTGPAGPNALAPAADYKAAAEKFCADRYSIEDSDYYVLCKKWYYVELLQHKYEPLRWLNRVAYGGIGERGRWPNPQPGSEAQCRASYKDDTEKKTSKLHRGGAYKFVSKQCPPTDRTNSTSHPPSVQPKRKIQSNPKAANPTKKTKKASADEPLMFDGGHHRQDARCTLCKTTQARQEWSSR